MRRVRLTALVAAGLAVQLGFMPALRPLGVIPNLVLVLVVLVGLTGTATAALSVALVGGLLLDLTSGADFGLRMGIFVLAALVTGLVHRSGLTLAIPVVASVLVVAATVVQAVAVLAGMAGMVTSWPWGIVLGRLGMEVVLNLGLTILLAPLVRWAAPATQEMPGTA
jgi:rod shape-determining protein MreD